VTASVAGAVVRVVLPALASLLLAAHFYRSGIYPLAGAMIALAGLTFVSRPWAGRALGLTLLLGAVEWLRTAWVFASLRHSMGLPFARLLAILGAVALFTLVSAYVAWRGAETGVGRNID
jgi:hypothetical protein